MNINRDYISTKNTNRGKNKPKYIVIHETDNWSKGADARRHALAQFKGNLNTSVHFYTGSDGVYQAANLSDGTWSIGIEYGGKHSVKDATNNNAINIEICVNSDGNYNIAKQNCIELVRYLIKETGIPAERVIRHFDAKGKYCPRRMMDNPSLWADFKKQIGESVEVEKVPLEEKKDLFRVGIAWENGICKGQVGAFENKENAINKAKENEDWRVYDEEGVMVYPVKKIDSDVDVYYRARTKKDGWLPEVRNLEDYAGWHGEITDIAIRASKGSVKYRVHSNGKWQPYVTGCDIDDKNGYAGVRKPIDGIEVYYNTPSNIRPYKKAKYRVSTVGNNKYYPWQYDNETKGNMDGYAGTLGIFIDKFQICIE